MTWAQIGDCVCVVISLIRCMMNFSLLRSELRCIGGTRSTFANPIKNPSAINMIVSEGMSPQSDTSI